MYTLALCVVLCILSSASAMAVWSLCKFWAQTSRRAARRERRATRERAASRTHVYEASQPPRGVGVGGDAGSPERRLLTRRLSASDVGPATGNEKPGRLVKGRSAPLEETRRSELVLSAKRRHSLPRSGSFDQATATIARDQSARAADPRAHAPARTSGLSVDPSRSEMVPAGPRRRSLPRSISLDQAIAHDGAAESTLSAVAGGPSVPESTSPMLPSAPGGPPPLALPRSTSFERMLANDQDCPPTPLPRTAQARKPVSSSGSLNYAHLVFKRLTETELTVY